MVDVKVSETNSIKYDVGRQCLTKTTLHHAEQLTHMTLCGYILNIATMTPS